jgi:hypothetical protein
MIASEVPMQMHAYLFGDAERAEHLVEHGDDDAAAADAEQPRENPGEDAAAGDGEGEDGEFAPRAPRTSENSAGR